MTFLFILSLRYTLQYSALFKFSVTLKMKPTVSILRNALVSGGINILQDVQLVPPTISLLEDDNDVSLLLLLLFSLTILSLTYRQTSQRSKD